MTDATATPVKFEDDRWDDLEERLRGAMELSNAREFEQTVEACRGIIADYPANAEPQMVLGLVALLCGDEGQALSFLSAAHDLDPETKEYVHLLAMVSSRVGRLTDAVYYAKIAEVCEPHPFLASMLPPDFTNLNRAFEFVRPSGHNLNGQRSLNLGRYQQALKEFMAEIRINPDNEQALHFLSHSALMIGNPTQAIGASQSLLYRRPDDAMARALLARGLARAGREGEAIAVADAAIARGEDDADVFVSAMDALLACPSVEAEGLKKRAQAFNDLFDENDIYGGADDAAEDADTVADDAIHVAIVSNTFHRSAISDFAATWVAGLSGRGTRTTGFQFSVLKDAVTTLYKGACDSWRDMVGVDAYTLATILERENIDCLIDLSVPGVESCATTIALKPAPIRIGAAALAEPGLSPGVTHILSDESLEYGDRSMLLAGQHLLTIPGTLFARPPFDTLPQDTPTPMASNGFPTFGLIAHDGCVSPAFAQTVGRILEQTPGSRLLVYGAESLDETARKAFRESFMHAGVADRLLSVEADDGEAEAEDGDEAAQSAAVLQRLESRIAPAVWGEIDVLLDTYPTNGCTDLIEALWSGVPTVTRRGRRRASCVGASIVSAAGRTEWVTRTDDEFVATATDLANDVDALAKHRVDLQASVAASALFDPKRTARAVREVIVRACQARRAEVSIG